MQKLITSAAPPGLSVLAWALASRIACRSEPGPLSLVFWTVKGLATQTSAANSDVSDVASDVAVALANCPTGTGVVVENEKLTLPLASVVTDGRAPRNVCPSPKPLGSAAVLAKN